MAVECHWSENFAIKSNICSDWLWGGYFCFTHIIRRLLNIRPKAFIYLLKIIPEQNVAAMYAGSFNSVCQMFDWALLGGGKIWAGQRP